MLSLPSNVGPPAVLTVTIKSPAYSGDLTQATGVTASMQRQNGTIVALTGWVIVSATPYELVAQYPFTGSEVVGTGAYRVSLALTVPGGSLPAQPFGIFFSTPFSGTPIYVAETTLAVTQAVLPMAPALSVADIATLSAAPTLSLAPGTLGYVRPVTANALGVYYALAPTNTWAPDGNLVLAAAGGGRWLKLAIGLALS